MHQGHVLKNESISSGEKYAGQPSVTSASTHAVDRDHPCHRSDRIELHGSLDPGDRQSENTRGVRHQRHRDRGAGIGLGADLRDRTVAVGLSAGSDRPENPGRCRNDPVVAVPGGGRAGRHLLSVDAVADRTRRDRGPVLSVGDALGQRLVRCQGPRHAEWRVYVGRLYRADARPADPDRGHARLQLAGDVHRHGSGRDRGCRSLVPDLPRPEGAGAGTAGRRVSAVEPRRRVPRFRCANGPRCSGFARCGC